MPPLRVWVGENLSVGAQSKKDARRLVELFAEHLIGEADFFSAVDADQVYTLDPVRDHGARFEFNWRWDPEVRNVRVREVKFEDGRAGERKSYSPWSLTVRDSRNALTRLVELAPGLDLASLRVAQIKLEFELRIADQDSKLIVTVTPPGTASFRDHAFEQKIWEHLERNGIRRRPRAVPADLAAE